jgi:hypothetical protein
MMRLLTVFVVCGLVCAAVAAHPGRVIIAMAEPSQVNDAINTVKDVAGKTDAEASDGAKSTTTPTNGTAKPPTDPIGTVKKIYTDDSDKSTGAAKPSSSTDPAKAVTDTAKQKATDLAKDKLAKGAKAGAKQLSPVLGGIILVVALAVVIVGLGLLRKLAHRLADAINDRE